MLRIYLKLLCVGLFVLIYSRQLIHAQTTQITVGSVTIDCFYPTRQAVSWYADPSLNDVGYTTPKGIYYNPTVLSRMSQDLQLFWLGHECGHATLQTSVEERADCWSAQTGVRQGWLSPADADQLAADMANNPGDNSHPPGPERVAHVRACMSAVASSAPSGGGHSHNSAPVPSDPTSNNFDIETMCPTLASIVEAASDNFSSITGVTRTPRSSFATVKLPLANACFIQTTSQASYKCSFNKVYYKNLIDKVMGCYPESTKSGDADMMSIRLQTSTGGLRIAIYGGDEATFEMFASKQSTQ